MWIAGIGCFMVLAALAWRRASAHPRHAAVALVMTVGVAQDVVRRGLRLLNEPYYAAAAGAPLHGAGRAIFHVGQALTLSWPFGLAALAAWVFLAPDGASLAEPGADEELGLNEDGGAGGPYRLAPARVLVRAVARAVARGERHRGRVVGFVAALWGLTTLAVAVAYPVVRRAVWGRCYLAIELAAVASMVGMAWGWWPRRRAATLTEGTLLVWIPVEAVALVQWEPFAGIGWAWQGVVYLVGFGALVYLHLMTEVGRSCQRG